MRKIRRNPFSVGVSEKRDIYWVRYIKQDPSWDQWIQKALEDREDSTVSSFLQKSFSSSLRGWRGVLFACIWKTHLFICSHITYGWLKSGWGAVICCTPTWWGINNNNKTMKRKTLGWAETGIGFSITCLLLRHFYFLFCSVTIWQVWTWWQFSFRA